MKYFFSFLLFLSFNSFCISQTFLFKPMTNYSLYNNNQYNQKQQNSFQKQQNNYLYYPLNNIPPLQSNGYTLQNTQPYVGNYYFNLDYWLLKR